MKFVQLIRRKLPRFRKRKNMHSSPINKKAQKISVWCTATEKRYIEVRAREAKLSASEYLREMGLRENLKRPKTLSPEVLSFNGRLLHLAGLLQPLSRRRLDGDELNALERATLQQLSKELQSLITHIKTYCR